MSRSSRAVCVGLPYYLPFTEQMAQHCLQAGGREDGERNLSPIFIETSHSWQDGSLLGLYGTSRWSSSYTALCFSAQLTLCTFPVTVLWTSVGTHPPVPRATQPQERSHADTKALASQQGGLRTGGAQASCGHSQVKPAAHSLTWETSRQSNRVKPPSDRLRPLLVISLRCFNNLPPLGFPLFMSWHRRCRCNSPKAYTQGEGDGEESPKWSEKSWQHTVLETPQCRWAITRDDTYHCF